ncbi:MAG TPA: alpha/beta hydrolase [Oculatellaceae cyanobacterium]|jgi:pimeloyl-ACP methyl ester carboxylesterase
MKMILIISLLLILLLTTSIYHTVASKIEKDKYPPPGQLIDVGGYKLHLYSIGEGSPTVIFDHSLGSLGWSNYLVFNEIAKITRVVVCDRAGYGYSETSPKPRTSAEIVQELHTLLTKADIPQPYIFVGDSFGGYTARLYADKFPNQVVGMVLTHALHEDTVLNFPFSIIVMKIVFLIGFKLTQISAYLGMIRLSGLMGLFEFFKKELRQFNENDLIRLKMSFYSAKHWEAMFREVKDITSSSKQIKNTGSLSNLPLVVISVQHFLKRSLLTFFLPLRQVDEAWTKMQPELLKLSSNSKQIIAANSGHFVWIDEPEVMIKAINELIEQIRSQEL